MNNLSSIIEMVNLQLNQKDFTIEAAVPLMQKLAIAGAKHISLIDYSFFNERTLLYAKKERTAGIRAQNFEWAKKYSLIEEKCLYTMSFKEKFHIRKPSLVWSDDKLYYFYMGKTTQENMFRGVLDNIFHPGNGV